MNDRAKLMLLGPVPVALILALAAAASWSRSDWQPLGTVVVMEVGLFSAAAILAAFDKRRRRPRT